MEDKEIGKAKFGALGFGLIAMACAVFAGFIVYSFITSSKLKEEKNVKVLVITADLNAGDEIKKEMVKEVERPESQVPVKAARSLEHVFKDGKKRVAATGILAGEFVFDARLADPDRGTAMAALVQHGFRAVPVKVDGAVARSGLVHPGAFVDIVGTIRDPKSFVSTTRVAVENVRVLSVEAATDVETYKNAEKKKEGGEMGGGGAPNTNNAPQDAVMTIEVTPEQMEVVLLAQREGKVDVALRNAADKDSVPTKGATPARLIGQSAQQRSSDVDEREVAARAAAEAARAPHNAKKRVDAKPAAPEKASAPVVMAPGSK